MNNPRTFARSPLRLPAPSPITGTGTRAPATRIAALTLFVALFAAPLFSAGPDGDLDRLLHPEGVEPITAAQFAQVLAAHRGKVVIVNLWATFCVPCLQELPDLDLVQERLRDRGLLVLAISMDNPDHRATKVGPFFSKQAPHLITYVNAEADEFEFVTSFDPDWVGALPTTYFYSRDGKLLDKHVGRLMYRDFERKALELLGDE